MKTHTIARRSMATLLFAFAALAAQAGSPAKRLVLPDDVTPQHYRVDFTPDSEALTFSGSVEIEVVVKRATDHIVLNAADLVIDAAGVVGETPAPKLSYDQKVQTVTLALARPLATGAHTLTLKYHGTIYQSASGLFALD